MSLIYVWETSKDQRVSPTSQLRFGCFNGSFINIILFYTVESNQPDHTFDHVVLGDALTPGHPVGGDVFDALLEYGPDPDADIGRHYVHQAEPGEALELVDVQLKHCILNKYTREFGLSLGLKEPMIYEKSFSWGLRA